MTPTKGFSTTHLRNKAEEFANIAPKAQWYLFGSYSRPESAPTAHDVDILIVYPAANRNDAIHLYGEVCEDFKLQFVDITLLTYEEEKSLEFIRRENAIPLWPRVDRQDLT
ncbi:nucleotidyltransferase domain-containing protein [Streptomyces tauricus]|uniref:nucleotidyltransferase domain-containing protein n=1 Tax=Streptomyces tauricus TaxID=68274 RepID=UPI0033AC1646